MDERLQEMSFWDHVDALRTVLIRMAVVLIVGAVALFVFMPQIFDNVILAPCHANFPLYRLIERATTDVPGIPAFHAYAQPDVQLINIQLASQFFLHITTSLYAALVLTFPILLWLLWSFVSPALYRHERAGARLAMTLATVMFFAGVAIGYFLVFPITLRFLAGYQVSQWVPNQISLDSYMDTFFSLLLVMGITFELPLACWLLGRLHLLHRNTLRTYRRHAVVLLLLAAAIITPTGDPVTLSIVFLPLYLLYELGVWLVPDTSSNTQNTT